VGKELLFSRLSECIRNDRSLPIRWECAYCGEEHDGNLVKLARRVGMEENLGGCRPDLVLFDAQDVPVAILEVVVTHAPDENVLEFCQQEGVTRLEFRIRSGFDLLALEHERPLRPGLVDLCLRSQCQRCGQPLERATMHVIEVQCWRCGFQMLAALVRAADQVAGPEVFSEKQVKQAEQCGVLLRRNYSSSSRTSYVANTCPTCGAFIGAPYLRYHGGKTRGQAGRPVGSVCLNCGSEPPDTK
jgi:hypothetical protein